jgi:hypothetical protein
VCLLGLSVDASRHKTFRLIRIVPSQKGVYSLVLVYGNYNPRTKRRSVFDLCQIYPGLRSVSKMTVV